MNVEGPAPGRLVVVATPIGNLGDLSPRAVEELRAADIVASEDTRHTGRLLAHAGVATKQLSYHEHNEAARTPQLVQRMLQGQTVALVSDAGTPLVSDPGFRLVRACAEAGIAVTAVPGPSALLHALVVSGFATDRFVFEGFLPRAGGKRGQRLAELVDDTRTLIVYVAPMRLAADLADLAAALGPDREAAVCRELTKLHEQVDRGSLGRLAQTYADRSVKGEITLVVAGRTRPERAPHGDRYQAVVESG